MEQTKKINDTDYMISARTVKELESKFDGDFHTTFFKPENFGEFLCAQAYGLIGKEIFYDATFTHKIADMKREHLIETDSQFYQGMISYSILQKVAKAKAILESSEFAKSKTIDMTMFDQGTFHDYATQAFVLYYAYTQGYYCDWSKMDHRYSALNFDYKPNVEFENVERKTAPALLISEVESDLGIHREEGLGV